jgi:hypothetical protein
MVSGCYVVFMVNGCSCIYIYTEDNGDSPGLNGVNRTGDGVAEVQQYQYDLLRTFTL